MASYFWVGGTGTWGATNTQFATSTGGSPTANTPGSADTVTFDANSGGGTVTVNTTVNVTSITMGAFTGTLDFSVNNNNVTVQTLSNSGSGTRTLKMGSGTWAVTGISGTIWDFTTTTGLTFNAGTSTLVFTPSANTGLTRTITLGASATYSTLSLGTNTGGGSFSITNQSGITVGTLLMPGPNDINFQQVSLTITNPISINSGSLSSMVYLNGGNNGTLSIATGSTMQYCVIRQMTFTGAGSGLTATNSIDLGGNVSVTINTPANSSGGGGIIGS